ncbi:hypothetical protein KY289_012075 [Solanum tuberosum]|nr:hypothetical protein KY289_012075 [Solanum tuberosum]
MAGQTRIMQPVQFAAMVLSSSLGSKPRTSFDGNPVHFICSKGVQSNGSSAQHEELGQQRENGNFFGGLMFGAWRQSDPYLGMVDGLSEPQFQLSQLDVLGLEEF